MARKNSKQTGLRNKWFIVIFLFIGLFIFFSYLYSKNYSQLSKNAQTPDSTTLKKYTNSQARFSLMYPDNWTLKESHWASNREIDDPKEINTVIIKNGNDNEIRIQWGPMGFGGACPDVNNQKILKLKNETIKICRGIITRADNSPDYDFDGNVVPGIHENWSQIYPSTKNKEMPIGIDVIASPSESETISKIFSTLEVTNQ